MLAAIRTNKGNLDIWLIDALRGALRRFTFDPAEEQLPVWSPDGRQIAFGSYRNGVNDLYVKSLIDGSPEQVLVSSAANKNISDWSADGRFILFTSNSSTTGRDLWALPLEGDRKPVVVDTLQPSRAFAPGMIPS